MQVVSVNVGGASRLSFDGDRLSTGIFKSPVVAPAFLTPTGFRGDVQVDRENHGGEDKAVCVYERAHLDDWADRLGLPFPAGTFGENLTVTGMQEDEVRIGDVYAIGASEVQVSQPRQPCHKLAKKIGDLEFANQVIEGGQTGFYFRVLKTGHIAPGDSIETVSRNPEACTIDFANRVFYRHLDGPSGIKRLLAEDALSDSWRQMLSARL